MTSVHSVVDKNGDLIDLVYFCGDFCHQQWCKETDHPYDGWNGCHEIQHNETCADCGALIKGASNESANI